MPETPRGLNPESQKEAEKPRLEVRAESGSRASWLHHDYNEDANLGDDMRVQGERIDLPPLGTVQRDHKDKMRLQEALNLEAKYAKGLKDLGVFGVLDGVGAGGNGTGLIGSRVAAGRISEYVSHLPKDLSLAEWQFELKSALIHAHESLLELKKSALHLKSAATTADVIKVMPSTEGGYDMAWAHSGDSRIYVYNEETGLLEQVTPDQSYIGEALAAGKITDQEAEDIMNAPSQYDLPEHLRELHVLRASLTNAVGTKYEFVPVSGTVTGLTKKHRVLIFSDGVHDNLGSRKIAEMLAAGASANDILAEADRVAQSGRGRAKPDDISGTEIRFAEAA